ncbi:MAG: MAPEG family protein [Woeseiaceae bacterium]|nr:MAPEG family protein [Woeseiaceae bacterium]
MPVEIQVLGYAALLQFIQYLLMAVPVNIQLGTQYTGGNRDEESGQPVLPDRLKRALDNDFEALLLFTIAAVVVVLGDAPRA